MATVAADIQRILSDDFAQSVVVTPPGGAGVGIVAYANKHNITTDANGFISVNTMKARVTVAIGVMQSAGFDIYDTFGKLINFENWLFQWTDPQNVSVTYVCPRGGSVANESTGLITFTLQYYKPPTP